MKLKVTFVILISLLFSGCTLKKMDVTYNTHRMPSGISGKLVCEGIEDQIIREEYGQVRMTYPISDIDRDNGYFKIKKCSMIYSNGSSTKSFPDRVNIPYIRPLDLNPYEMKHFDASYFRYAEIKYDTYPQSADIFCDGEYKGKSPTKVIQYKATLKKNSFYNVKLKKCKAVWSSGYTLEYPESIESDKYIFSSGTYFLKQTLFLKRPTGDGYTIDVQTDMYAKNAEQQSKNSMTQNAQLLRLQSNQNTMMNHQNADSARDILEKQKKQMRSFGIKTY